MRALLLSSVFAVTLTAAAHAQAPASQDMAQVLATCRDGTSFAGHTRRGACAGHGGVQAFGAGPAAAAAGSVANPLALPMPGPSMPGSAAMTAAPVTPPLTRGTPVQGVAAGGGVGQVWVNLSTKVYHGAGDRYYGKTSRGSYMTQAAAQAEGDRPARGRVCS